MRIVQISDTHISHLGGVTSSNFSHLVDFVNDELRPDLIVNSGDVSILTPDSPDDRETARSLHARFAAPVRVLPGNHDVGEAGDHPWMELSVTSDRVAGFRRTFGADHFLELGSAANEAENWAVIGINSEILSSGLPEEADQWAWLTSVAEEIRDRWVLLFLHKPLWSPLDEYTEHALAITEGDRDRILATLAGARLRAIGSGHLHTYRSAVEGDILTVWAPSSAFVVRSAEHQFGGLNQLGVVEYRIEGDAIEAYFRSIPTLHEDEPYGMSEFTTTMATIEAAVSA
jgi:3',5'-cyclic AMP phosphodiesterase CpdA